MFFPNIRSWALARRFYEKQGFRENGDTMSCEIGGVTVTDLRYINDNM